LDTLIADILSNTPFRELNSDNIDVKIWNKVLDDFSDEDGNRPTWVYTNWLYTECYIHRRLFEAFETRLVVVFIILSSNYYRFIFIKITFIRNYVIILYILVHY
jgi:hypothetical protein